MHRATVGSYGGSVSYERDTPLGWMIWGLGVRRTLWTGAGGEDVLLSSGFEVCGFFFFFFFFFFLNLQPLFRSTTDYAPHALDKEPRSLTDILRLS